LLSLQCPVGCFASLRSLSCCLQFRLIPHGSYCVLHATSFISSSFRFITPVRSYAVASRQGSPLTRHRANTRSCTGLSQAHPAILTGFHYAALRHTFTSVAFSPPAAHYFACRLATVCVSGLLWQNPCLWADTHATFSPCTVRPSLPLVAFLSAPSGGARRRFYSFLIPAAFWHAVPPRLTADKCAAGLCFFLAAGAFTGRLTPQFAYASKKALLNC
jgi:hypothetical protein